MSGKTATRRARRKNSRVQDYIDGMATAMDLTGSLMDGSSYRSETALRNLAAEAVEEAEAYGEVGVVAFTRRVGAFLARAGAVAERESHGEDPPTPDWLPPGQS